MGFFYVHDVLVPDPILFNWNQNQFKINLI
jgi:hypothetical protein